MRILITGHSGFIGSYLTSFISKNHEIFLLKNDLLDFEAVKTEVLDIDPEIIVHLAARTEVEKSFYEQNTFSQINYVGSINLIDTACKLQNFKSFMFASTMEVYGWQPISDIIKINQKIDDFHDIPVFDENTPPNPNAPYAVAKYAVEKYLEYVHRAYDFPFCALRQTNCYGRKDNDFFVTEKIVSQMLQTDEIFLGNPLPYRNFLFIDDLLDAWVVLIENYEKMNGKILTIGPNNVIQIQEYVKLIADKIGWEGQITWNTGPGRPGEIFWLNSDHKLITNLTGWRPKVTLEIGIEKTIEIWKEKISNDIRRQNNSVLD